MKRELIRACGMGCLAVALGCGEMAAPTPSDAAKGGAAATASDEHSHGAGPHGGAITDWGGGAYHVEFLVDHESKNSTVYVLSSDGKTAAPVKATKLLLSINDPAFQVELMAQSMEGEGDGASSRFVGQHDNLGIVREFAGSISGEVDGTPYVGEFAEVAAARDQSTSSGGP